MKKPNKSSVIYNYEVFISKQNTNISNSETVYYEISSLTMQTVHTSICKKY